MNDSRKRFFCINPDGHGPSYATVEKQNLNHFLLSLKKLFRNLNCFQLLGAKRNVNGPEMVL